MRKLTSIALVAAGPATAAALALAPAAAAAPDDLAGRWNSAALRMDDVGYSLKLPPSEGGTADAYDGVLRFHFQDGTTGRRIKVGVTAEGSTVSLVMPGGSLATGAKTLTGTIGQDGSIYFKNCQTQLPYVTRKTAPEMCLFQELPR